MKQIQKVFQDKTQTDLDKFLLFKLDFRWSRIINNIADQECMYKNQFVQSCVGGFTIAIQDSQ